MTNNLKKFSPYLMGLAGKNAEEESAMEDRIDALPESVRDLLFDPDLPERLSGAAAACGLGEQFTVALAKLVFLTILGDVPVTAFQELLVKLGVETPVAASLTTAVNKIMEPLVSARAGQATQQGMKPLQPLTQRIGAPPQLVPTPRTASDNIIDLRKSQEHTS